MSTEHEIHFSPFFLNYGRFLESKPHGVKPSNDIRGITSHEVDPLTLRKYYNFYFYLRENVLVHFQNFLIGCLKIAKKYR